MMRSGWIFRTSRRSEFKNIWRNTSQSAPPRILLNNARMSSELLMTMIRVVILCHLLISQIDGGACGATTRKGRKIGGRVPASGPLLFVAVQCLALAGRCQTFSFPLDE